MVMWVGVGVFFALTSLRGRHIKAISMLVWVIAINSSACTGVWDPWTPMTPIRLYRLQYSIKFCFQRTDRFNDAIKVLKTDSNLPWSLYLRSRISHFFFFIFLYSILPIIINFSISTSGIRCDVSIESHYPYRWPSTRLFVKLFLVKRRGLS